MDEITKAILAASIELALDYGWTLDDDGHGELPTEDSRFVRIMHKHLAVFGTSDAVKQARITSLRAELEALERT